MLQVPCNAMGNGLRNHDEFYLKKEKVIVITNVKIVFIVVFFLL